ncbi:MAG: hypothetical protein J6Q84_01635 [Kiritimatiellae bacterium]|nr:hypothetical protein [Kiritimatiellia bacterium]
MGTGDYTRRRVSLGNLGEVRKVELPDLQSSAHAAAKLGQSVAGFGRDIGRGFQNLIVDLAAIKKEKEDRELAIDATEIKKIWRQRMTNPKNGYVHRQGVGADGVSAEAGEAFENDMIAIAGEKSEEHQNRLKLMLAPQRDTLLGSLMQQEARELRASSIRAADELVKSDSLDWAMGAMNNTSAQRAIQNRNHAMNLHTEWSGPEREAYIRDWALSRYADLVLFDLRGATEEVHFDAILKRLKEDPETYLKDLPSLKGELTSVQVSTKLLPDDFMKGLIKKVEDAKLGKIGEKEHQLKKDRDALKAKCVQFELDLMGKDLPDSEYMLEYKKMADDVELRKLAPEVALKYLETYTRIKDALEKKDNQIERAKQGHFEEELSRRLTWNMFCQAEGTYDPQKIATDQAEIWREYKAAMIEGKVSDSFAQTFGRRLKTNLTEQEARAMRMFYSAFGYTGELDKEGYVPASSQKAFGQVNFLVPAESERIRGWKLFELGESFLRTLKELDSEVYRPEAMEKVISKMKTDWFVGDFNANRSARVQDLIDIQRNYKAKENLNVQEGKSGEASK